MSLDLDKRQRAMLAEMGIKVWWPQTEAAAAPVAASPTPAATAAPAAPAAPTAPRPTAPARALPPGMVPASSLAPAAPKAAPAPARPAPAAAAPAERSAEPAAASGSAWQVGDAQLLAGEGDPAAERGQRWLLLAEGRPEELSDGAGQLLRNMLRAARLHQGAQVWMAPLQRSSGAPQVHGLDEVLGRTEPDVVFVMSRLGAQALLETDLPLGRLRGQVHDLWGMPAVVSYDLGALMRTPMEKAKAWDDLCLALQVAQAQHAERMAAE